MMPRKRAGTNPAEEARQHESTTPVGTPIDASTSQSQASPAPESQRSNGPMPPSQQNTDSSETSPTVKTTPKVTHSLHLNICQSDLLPRSANPKAGTDLGLELPKLLWHPLQLRKRISLAVRSSPKSQPTLVGSNIRRVTRHPASGARLGRSKRCLRFQRVNRT